MRFELLVRFLFFSSLIIKRALCWGDAGRSRWDRAAMILTMPRRIRSNSKAAFHAALTAGSSASFLFAFPAYTRLRLPWLGGTALACCNPVAIANEGVCPRPRASFSSLSTNVAARGLHVAIRPASRLGYQATERRIARYDLQLNWAFVVLTTSVDHQ